MLITKSMLDEIFVVRECSVMIDVARLIDSINCREIGFKYEEMKVERLLSFSTADRVNADTVSAISESRRDEPIILSCFNGDFRIIDGNHRLVRRQRDGFFTCSVVSVSLDVLGNFMEPLGF